MILIVTKPVTLKCVYIRAEVLVTTSHSSPQTIQLNIGETSKPHCILSAELTP